MLYLCGVDAAAPASRSDSKYFWILFFGLLCVENNCIDGKTANGTAQKPSNSSSVFHLSDESSIIEEAGKPTAHTAINVNCILNGNALVPYTKSSEILRNW